MEAGNAVGLVEKLVGLLSRKLFAVVVYGAALLAAYIYVKMPLGFYITFASGLLIAVVYYLRCQTLIDLKGSKPSDNGDIAPLSDEDGGKKVIPGAVAGILLLLLSSQAFAFEWVDYLKDSMSGVVAYEFLQIEDQCIGGKYDAHYFADIISPSLGYITNDSRSAWGAGFSLKVNRLAEICHVDYPLRAFDVPVGLAGGYGTGKAWYLWVQCEVL